MATKKKTEIDIENVNTTESIFKDSKVSDSELSVKSMQENAKLVKVERVPYKCKIEYAALYPNGFESTCQGIYIYLIFDGRTVELPKFIAEYVDKKIEAKAMSLVDKKVRNTKKKQEYLGMEVVE